MSGGYALVVHSPAGTSPSRSSHRGCPSLPRPCPSCHAHPKRRLTAGPLVGGLLSTSIGWEGTQLAYGSACLLYALGGLLPVLLPGVGRCMASGAADSAAVDAWPLAVSREISLGPVSERTASDTSAEPPSSPWHAHSAGGMPLLGTRVALDYLFDSAHASAASSAQHSGRSHHSDHHSDHHSEYSADARAAGHVRPARASLDAPRVSTGAAVAPAAGVCGSRGQAGQQPSRRGLAENRGRDNPAAVDAAEGGDAADADPIQLVRSRTQ
jgi:hypothetical protein